MNLKIVSTISDIIGILAVAILFIMNYKNECFKVGEWYITLLPIFMSYLAQIITIFTSEEE